VLRQLPIVRLFVMLRAQDRRFMGDLVSCRHLSAMGWLVTGGLALGGARREPGGWGVKRQATRPPQRTRL
jgi:hypothetical protein